MLAKQPAAKLKVYAVWFNMMASDQRSEWPSMLLTDPRVTNFWDERKLLGTWYATFREFSNGSGNAVWDAFFVYNSASRWTDQPSGLMAWGSTIISHKNQLAEAVTSSFKHADSLILSQKSAS